jgi:hypothetical protein
LAGASLTTPLSRFKIDGAIFGENGAEKHLRRALRRRAKSSAWRGVSERFFADFSSLPSEEKWQKKNKILSQNLCIILCEEKLRSLVLKRFRYPVLACPASP